MFARQAHVSAHDLIYIPPAWSFACWGLNQVGPLKKAKGRFEYIFVAFDKFTKWIEYKPLMKYSVAKAVKFIQDIMHRLRIPNRIIIDLGSLLHPSSSEIRHKTAASIYIIRQLHTPKPTDKWKEPMDSYKPG
jgi:hypothetical protein